jgi:ActR/RegA family two-component response regulator
MYKQPILPIKNPDTSSSSLPSSSRIVLALDGLPNALELKQLFLTQGFDVHTAKTSIEVRKMSRQLRPAALILSTELGKLESGWLTCKKLLLENPTSRIVLIGSKPSAKSERFADFLGATAYLSTSSSPQAIARAALGCELPSVN